MTKPIVRDSRGPVSLGTQLGKGGEGSVYEIVGSSERVAKVYHHPASTEKTAKLQAMVGLKNDWLLSLAAWPLDVLHSPQGQPIGLIMPMVAGHRDIHTLYGPRSRKAEFPNADWRFLIRAAANTAKAFAAIHETGCIIGDVNHGGIRVSDKATVKLIDCDSFQVTARGRQFLCEVGTPTFTPPELQGKPFRGVVRSANHDNFGLATLIFHLLYMGRHPFAGRFLGRGDMGIEQAIAEFRFAYGANRGLVQMDPPPNVPALSIASQPVTLMMERAFSREGARDGVRPTAREWISALEALEKQLKKCHVNVSHHYLNSLSHCPWCHLEAATGVVLFNLFIQRDPQIGHVDVTAIWSRITAIQPPGIAPEIANWNHLSPSPEAVAQGRGRRAKRIIGYSGLVAAVVALFNLAPGGLLLWIIGGFFAFSAVGNWVGRGGDTSKYKDAARVAEDRWRSLTARWEQDSSDQRFATHLRQLEHERDQLRDLPNVRQRRYQELAQSRERQQLRRFLERFEIERAKITGIGPGRTAVLESYNIETAWDVTESHVMRVPGFGPALTRELMKWRQGLEAKFRFDATKGVDPQDIAALDREISDTRRKLEQSLANGPQTLYQIRTHILAQRDALKPQMDDAAKVLAQALADLKAVS